MPDETTEQKIPWRPFVLDMNGDGNLTISDVGLWLEQAFFLPGDGLIWVMLTYAPSVSGFLEVSAVDYGSSIAALLSVLSWLCVISVVLITTHYIGELDRALTHTIVSLYQRARVKALIAARLVKSRLFRERKKESG